MLVESRAHGWLYILAEVIAIHLPVLLSCVAQQAQVHGDVFQEATLLSRLHTQGTGAYRG